MPSVVFIAGSTATGKSEWALRIAVQTDAYILNCDSVQLYQGLLIGSGAPSSEDRRRANHLLYNEIVPPKEITAGDYRKLFFKVLSDLPEESQVLVVGGTGFYFQAIEKGMFQAPPIPEEISLRIRQEVNLDGPVKSWEKLNQLDPASAEKISANDSYRICRALELSAVGMRLSELKAEFSADNFPYPLLKVRVGRDRGELRQRIHERAKLMIDTGLRQEVQSFLDRGFGDWAPLSSVGYKQTVQAIREKRSDDWLLDEISLRTSQLAKRQETWFKRDLEMEVFQGDASFPAFQDRVLNFLKARGTLGSS